MTEAVDREVHNLEKLRELLSIKIDRELSIFELNKILIQFGLENIENLSNRIDKLQQNNLSENEKQIIFDRMNELPDDENFTEQDAIEIGKLINDGIVKRYLEDTKKGD